MRRRTNYLPRLERGAVPGIDVAIARSFRARLIGLAGSGVRVDRRIGLLIPRTSSVHTFAMSFDLDLIWLDGEGVVLRVDGSVPPGAVRACRRADAVIEVPAGVADAAGIANGSRVAFRAAADRQQTTNPTEES